MGLTADAAGDELASELLAPADVNASTSPTSAQFYARQWNMRAVFADRAWAAGFLGSRDVVVAIVDAGIDYLHPDLVGSWTRTLEIVRARGGCRGRYPIPWATPISDLNYHGTAIASITRAMGRSSPESTRTLR